MKNWPFLFLLLFPIALAASEMHFPWVVYYDDQEPIEVFAPYNPIVLESTDHPPLTPLLAKQKEVLGYVNLGEAEDKRSWFSQVKNAGILLHENPDWKGAWTVDIRNPLWKSFLLDQIIPKILSEGFTGLFYDQLDVVIALEQKDPQTYKGMMAAAVDLVKAIRERYPDKKIMMNRAYQIIDQVGDAIDYTLAESLYTNYNFTTQKYSVRSQEEYDWQMNFLNKGRQKFPHLVVFSLDYWNPEDTDMYKKIYALERENCLRPYVSIISLNKVIPEPK